MDPSVFSHLSKLQPRWLSCLRFAIAPWPVTVWYLVSIICFAYGLPNPNQAGVKTAQMFLRRTPRCDRSTTLLQALHELSQFCGGSSRIPVDYATMTMPALVTLNTNIEDLNKVISRSQIQNSKEGQSVSLWCLRNNISRFPLSAKTT